MSLANTVSKIYSRKYVTQNLIYDVANFCIKTILKYLYLNNSSWNKLYRCIANGYIQTSLLRILLLYLFSELPWFIFLYDHFSKSLKRITVCLKWKVWWSCILLGYSKNFYIYIVLKKITILKYALVHAGSTSQKNYICYKITILSFDYT